MIVVYSQIILLKKDKIVFLEMLLEYTLETKEDDLKDRAIELRKRFAGRRLNDAINKGLVSANDLVRLKESNRDERLENYHDQYEIVNAGVGNRVTLARAEQQLEIQQSLRALDRDVARASRLGKSRKDTLTELENRIGKLRYLLKNPAHTETVDTQLTTELHTSSSAILEKNFTVCKRCNRRVLTKLFDAHTNACKKLNSAADETARLAIFDVNINPTVQLATFPPQPPRLCNLVTKGSTYIEFSWEPPIMDGGLPIFEYEIRYKTAAKIFDTAMKAWRRHVTDLPIMKTSRYI